MPYVIRVSYVWGEGLIQGTFASVDLSELCSLLRLICTRNLMSPSSKVISVREVSCTCGEQAS